MFQLGRGKQFMDLHYPNKCFKAPCIDREVINLIKHYLNEKTTILKMNTELLSTLIEECGELVINGFSDRFDVTRTETATTVQVWFPDEVEMNYHELFSSVILDAIRKDELTIHHCVLSMGRSYKFAL